MKIRPATEKDLQDIKDLLYLTWKDTYQGIIPDDVIEKITAEWHSVENLSLQLNNPKIIFFVAEENHKIIGVLTAQLISDREYYLNRLYILPEYQKKGLGKKLLNAFIILIDIAKITLEVEAENKKAVNFYQKEGFVDMSRKVSIIGTFYLQTIVMEKILN